VIGSKRMLIGAVAAGLLTAGAGASTLAAPAGAAAPATVLTAFSTPLDNTNGNWDHNNGDRGRDGNGGWEHNRGGDNRGWDRGRDNDHGRGWDGDRRGDGDWDGHDWHWWHNWGISAALCRDGGGHVRWDQHRCEGGRFDDFHVR
jgi:hypothetical protein